METQSPRESLKRRTARALKWNVVDRVASQVLYAITGIVLARELSQEEFGLVGAVLIFQAFASLLVDSGFSYALIQRKNPSRLDYSTVLWFNMGMAVTIYLLLWLAAPLIAACFGNDLRLIPLSRVMFLTFILNASSIVQANRFVKEMNVRPVAVSNALGLTAGSVVGIWMAVVGWGACAIVWQTIVTAAVKSVALWIWSRWLPVFKFSWSSLRSFMNVGAGMLATSFLNTLFLNIYSFFVGNRAGLVSLGYYTQSNKWSTMGISSLSQVLTSTSLPVLSEAQDDAPRFARCVRKFNRLTAYLLFPAMLGLVAVATPLFHALFGTKWDPSIILFQILLIRGIFTVLCSLYNNYLLSLGKTKIIVWMEVLRDGGALLALAMTFPWLTDATPENPVLGLTIMLWGQLAASVLAFMVTLWCVARSTPVSTWHYLTDLIPYLALATIACLPASILSVSVQNAWVALVGGILAGVVIYMGANAFLGAKVQKDAFAYIRGKL